jgi:hypothetical protein
MHLVFFFRFSIGCIVLGLLCHCFTGAVIILLPSLVLTLTLRLGLVLTSRLDLLKIL